MTLKVMRMPMAVGALLLMMMAPQSVSAQEAVYVASDLTTLPKMASMDKAARAVQAAYPEHLRTRGVSGTVQLQLIVGADGKVEPESIQVVSASVEELGDAAKKAATRLEFTPGKVNDAAVRAKVVLPITFRAS